MLLMKINSFTFWLTMFLSLPVLLFFLFVAIFDNGLKEGMDNIQVKERVKQMVNDDYADDCLFDEVDCVVGTIIWVFIFFLVYTSIYI